MQEVPLNPALQTQIPLVQLAVPVESQAMSHAPQLARSVRKSTQLPPHSTYGNGQFEVHSKVLDPDCTQLGVADGHLLPQRPQFNGLRMLVSQPSPLAFTRSPLQSRRSLSQTAPHWPPAQVAVACAGTVQGTQVEPQESTLAFDVQVVP